MTEKIIVGFIIRTTKKAWKELEEHIQLSGIADIVYVRRAPVDVKLKIVEILPREDSNV